MIKILKEGTRHVNKLMQRRITNAENKNDDLPNRKYSKLENQMIILNKRM